MRAFRGYVAGLGAAAATGFSIVFLCGGCTFPLPGGGEGRTTFHPAGLPCGYPAGLHTEWIEEPAAAVPVK